MSRTLLVGLALLGLVACGGGAENQAAAHTRKPAAAPRQSTTKPSTSASKRSKRKATTPAKRKATPADTSGKRNPLTNR